MGYHCTKPPEMTSSDGSLFTPANESKNWTCSTLDPGAAGVLVVCIGRATKIAEYMMDADKTYGD